MDKSHHYIGLWDAEYGHEEYRINMCLSTNKQPICKLIITYCSCSSY